MINTPSFIEDHISQIPALQLLQNLGYTYLTPAEAEAQSLCYAIAQGGLRSRKAEKLCFAFA